MFLLCFHGVEIVFLSVIYFENDDKEKKDSYKISFSLILPVLKKVIQICGLKNSNKRRVDKKVVC